MTNNSLDKQKKDMIGDICELKIVLSFHLFSEVVAVVDDLIEFEKSAKASCKACVASINLSSFDFNLESLFF